MKKLLGIVVLGLLFSSSTHAGLFDNEFFPSDRAKSFCVSDVYDGLGGIANENKTDKHKKILYKECIRQWYERRKK